jgi:hypothetical protein
MGYISPAAGTIIHVSLGIELKRPTRDYPSSQSTSAGPSFLEVMATDHASWNLRLIARLIGSAN